MVATHPQRRFCMGVPMRKTGEKKMFVKCLKMFFVMKPPQTFLAAFQQLPKSEKQ